MTITLTHRSADILTVEIDGTEVEIDTFPAAPDDTDRVYVGPTKDGKTTVSWLSLDNGYSGYDPIEDDEGVIFDSFRWGDPDRFEGDFEAVQAYLAADTEHRFLVECYQHGLVAYALKGSDEANRFPDRMFDVGVAGILTVPDDVTDPRRYAEGVLQAYTDYCNGNAYGVSYVEIVNGVPGEVESCWGFLGDDNAEGEAKALAGIVS